MIVYWVAICVAVVAGYGSIICKKVNDKLLVVTFRVLSYILTTLDSRKMRHVQVFDSAVRTR